MFVFDTTTAVIEIRQPSRGFLNSSTHFHTPLAESKRVSLPADINLVKGRFCVAQVTSFDPLKAGIPCVADLGRWELISSFDKMPTEASGILSLLVFHDVIC